MSGMAGVIFRPAFDDAAHILDQIEGGYARLILAESRGQRFPHDLRLRNATLASGCLQVRTDLVWDLTGDRGHDS